MKLHHKCLTVLTLVSLISACTIGNQFARNGQNASVTFGNVGVVSGEKAGHLSTINGNIEVSSNVIAKSAETVNGNVEVGENSHLDSIKTINGNIDIDENTIIKKNVSTVNGEITLAKNAHVKGDVLITNGKVELKANSVVSGNIIFEYTNYSSVFNHNFERSLIVEDSAIIEGKIIIYAPVKLTLPENFDRSKIDNRMTDKK